MEGLFCRKGKQLALFSPDEHSLQVLEMQNDGSFIQMKIAPEWAEQWAAEITNSPDEWWDDSVGTIPQEQDPEVAKPSEARRLWEQMQRSSQE